LSAEANETISLFRLLSDHRYDSKAIGAFILSMTSSVDDILAVCWLARHAGGGRADIGSVPAGGAAVRNNRRPGAGTGHSGRVAAGRRKPLARWCAMARSR
jgi:hypothetical protein